jgi:serine/threonine-protein kinase
MSDDFSDLSRSSLFALQGERAIVPVESASGPALIWPVGRVVDNKFEILALIGEGSMGRVYRVRHLLLKREVALKTIASVARGEAFLERFRREAQAIARLSHKNIIQVFDFGFIEEKFPYYTMECLTGCTLEQKLAKRGSLDLKQTVEIFVQICRALAAAHSKGIIHRDLKPANIFLADGAAYGSQTWVVKVVDFGVSTMALPDQPTEPKLTQADMIFGSPLYMSP